MSPNDKVHVSTSTLDTNTTIPPELQDQLKTALLHTGGIRNIESSLREELSRTGWTDNLRKHIQEMMRSGQAVTYNDIMAQLERDFAAGQSDNAVNGATVSQAINMTSKANSSQVLMVRAMALAHLLVSVCPRTGVSKCQKALSRGAFK